MGDVIHPGQIKFRHNNSCSQKNAALVTAIRHRFAELPDAANNPKLADKAGNQLHTGDSANEKPLPGSGLLCVAGCCLWIDIV